MSAAVKGCNGLPPIKPTLCDQDAPLSFRVVFETSLDGIESIARSSYAAPGTEILKGTVEWKDRLYL